MPIIPRYQPQAGPSVGGLNYAGAYSPPDGSDWRMLAQAATAAGTIMEGAGALFPQREGSPGSSAGAMPTRTDAIAGRTREAAWRRQRLESDGSGGAPAVAQSRQAAAEGLTGDAKAVFDALTMPREAGFAAAAAAREAAELRAAEQALSEDRQEIGVEEYVQLADAAPDQARVALASAVGEVTRRLVDTGAGQAAVDAGRRSVLSGAVDRRIRRVLAGDPQRASKLLETEGGMLEAAARTQLAMEIDAERTRQAAQRTVQRLAAEHQDVADDLEGLLAKVEAVSSPSPDQMVAYRGAAIGAWREARKQREASEDAAWRRLEPYLGTDSHRASWTTMPAQVWTALSPRQRSALRGHFEAPWKESDASVVQAVEATARASTEAFAEMDLTGMLGSLSAADFTRLRDLQATARRGGATWEEERGRLPQASATPSAIGAEPMLIKAAWAGPTSTGIGSQGALSERDKALNRYLDNDPLASDGLHVNADGQVVRRVPRRPWEPLGMPPKPWSEEIVSDEVALRFRAARLGVDPTNLTALSDREAQVLEAYFPDLAPSAQSLSEDRRRQLRRQRQAGEAFDRTPEIRAFGRLIAEAEGNVNYNTLGGDLQSKTYTRPIPDKHPGRVSGRYQINRQTWRQFGAGVLGATDYSPRTQDMAFVAILQDDKILDALLKGDFRKVLELASRRWASVPDPATDISRYTIGQGAAKRAQPSVPKAELERRYKAYLQEERTRPPLSVSPLPVFFP